MIEDLKDFDEELVETLSDCRKTLHAITSFPDVEEKRRAIKELSEHTTTGLQRLLTNLNAEISGIQDHEEKIEWKSRYDIHRENINQFRVDLEYQSGLIVKDALLKPEKKADERELGAKEHYDGAITLNYDTMSMIGEGIADLVEVEEIQKETLIALYDQRTRLVAISQDLSAMENDVKIARKRIGVFIRKLASDKLFLVLTIMILLTILALIVYVIITNE
eukprot:gnl/Carplike_NY0171/915_a1256_1710.p1 GENE.gnl/Carplike_NY0171/915_a1256_1710~~gnl/Carplike_NY0171/915_a1256_1710.p1  ORF type:complete len:230 (+),score=40.52 gnl/Carplike_NY0171/915_a1256_1710:29-691(+)